MKSYFKGRPPQGYKATDQRVVPFRDFSTAHDPVEYSRQRGDLEGGRLDKAYDDGKPQPVKGLKDGKSE